MVMGRSNATVMCGRAVLHASNAIMSVAVYPKPKANPKIILKLRGALLTYLTGGATLFNPSLLHNL